MADQTKIGTDWGAEELDLILADYFAMLAAEAEGRGYVKARHSAALMARIGRTHRSVEFKHMNISAVLGELGMPTIRGYKAKPNYQNAIFDAVDRYLEAHPEALVPAMPTVLASGMAEAQPLFEEPPPARRDGGMIRAAGLDRLVRKFDPGARDERNRVLGKAGEELVYFSERRRLEAADRPDLARKVRWVAQEDGDGAGFDILSFNRDGRERLVEVKTTRGTRTTPFLLTHNEHALSGERPEDFRIFRVFEFDKAPRLFRLKPPLEELVTLQAETWRASF
ncbi:MAG TPA: DUF3883 domain-containing protein [Caulobacteraceae bacterium]